MIKSSRPFLTDTVRRFVLWNAIIFVAILLLFNLFLFSVTRYVLQESLDLRLKHEAEKIISSLEVTDSSINIIDFAEFNEQDFTRITETPYFLQIYNSLGEVLIKSKNVDSYKPIPIDTNITKADNIFYNIEIEDDQLRVGYFSLTDAKGNIAASIQLATFEAQFDTILSKLAIFNLLSIPVISLIIVLASISLAKKSFSPINKIISIAENISEKNLKERILYKAKANDEMGKLRDTLNKLFERIETYISQLSGFTDYASHQLMNPLTAIRAELEYILRKNRSEAEYKDTLDKLLLQTDHMIKIVKTLLIISTHEKSNKKNRQIFNLSSLVKDKVQQRFSMFNIDYSLEEGIYLKGDAEKFFIILENIIDNALKYSDNSAVNVNLSKNNGSAFIKITDFGIGVPDEEKEKVFNKFYRTERSERLGIKGYGLGLSLAQTIISEAGGKIVLSDNKPKGTVVTIELPAVDLI